MHFNHIQTFCTCLSLPIDPSPQVLLLFSYLFFKPTNFNLLFPWTVHWSPARSMSLPPPFLTNDLTHPVLNSPISLHPTHSPTHYNLGSSLNTSNRSLVFIKAWFFERFYCCWLKMLVVCTSFSHPFLNVKVYFKDYTWVIRKWHLGSHSALVSHLSMSLSGKR